MQSLYTLSPYQKLLNFFQSYKECMSHGHLQISATSIEIIIYSCDDFTNNKIKNAHKIVRLVK